MFVLKEAQSYQQITTMLLARCAARNGVPYEVGGRNNRRIKWETLSSVDTRAKFAKNIARRFEQIPMMTTDIETKWQLFKSGILEAAA
ncbi:unnamed protein product [Soboliphyme baturini]|uniref:Transposase n=1 Tax=Soboliphyme baturini TaxID=241478 RepID=A0A183INP9_9BILA|nr:unnamed protein product [Soboliphyme baturini]